VQISREFRQVLLHMPSGNAAFSRIVGTWYLFPVHTRCFRLSVETFDTIHNSGMAAYKLGILLLNLAPLLALSLSD
jgi:hypothetical protein